MADRNKTLDQVSIIIGLLLSLTIIVHLFSWSYCKMYFYELGAVWVATQFTTTDVLRFSGNYFLGFLFFLALSFLLAITLAALEDTRRILKKIIIAVLIAYIPMFVAVLVSKYISRFYELATFLSMISMIVFDFTLASALVWATMPLLRGEKFEGSIKLLLVGAMILLFGLVILPASAGYFKARKTIELEGKNLPQVVLNKESEETIWRLVHAQVPHLYLADFEAGQGIRRLRVVKVDECSVLRTEKDYFIE